MASSRQLLEDPVGPTLLRLAAPMVVGIAAIMLFQAVDTFFVGQLGVAELAAMSFTFPVTIVVLSVTMGLSIGATAVIARAIGQGDPQKVQHLTTDALLLSVAVVTVVASIGLATMDPIFGLMGAKKELLPLIRSYMVPWYYAVGFLVIPMVGNGAIRATGDTMTPMVIMLIAGLVNLALDPLLIFGLGPFPRLEIQGAAIATGASWVITLVSSLWILQRRERMLCLNLPSLSRLKESWSSVLRIGLPAAATNVLIPLSTGTITAFVAEHGEDAVAAFGVGTRIEGLALVGVSALSTATTPFVGQNLGAKNFDRIAQALSFLARASLLWGLGMALLLGLTGPIVARLFSNANAVVSLSTNYLQVVPISYAFLGIAMIVGTMFSALGLPMRAALIVVMRLFVFAVPLAYLGSELLGVRGIFYGISGGNIAIGIIAFWFASSFLRSCRKREHLPSTAETAPGTAEASLVGPGL